MEDTCNSKTILDILDRKLDGKDVEPSTHKISNLGWEMGQNFRLRVHSLILHSVLLCARHNYAEALEYSSRALEICSTHHMALQLALVSLQSAEIQV